MPRQIDAHGLGGDLIVPDGLERPAVGGVDEQHDQQDAHTGDGGVGHHVLRRGEVVQRVGAVGQRAELAQLHQPADDLREAQRGDGQIVALQPQHRQANEECEERGHHACRQQRQHQRHLKLHQTVAVVAEHGAPQLHRDGQDRVGISAQQHEARLTQRKQAGEAVEQVHGHRRQREGTHLAQHREPHGRGRREGIHAAHQRHQHRHQDQVAEGALVFLPECRFHRLTPSPSFSLRRGPWA